MEVMDLESPYVDFVLAMGFPFYDRFDQVDGVSLKPPINDDGENQDDASGNYHEPQKFLAPGTNHSTA